MDPSYARAVVLAANLLLLVIRTRYGIRSLSVPVAKRRKRAATDVPLTIGKLVFYLPIIWAVTPLFAFADYPLHPGPFMVGIILYVFGLWLFHRTHVDLGRNWSETLEVRENHCLITDGVYTRIRHPMYLACMIFSVGQLLVLPNYVAGPSLGIAMLIIFANRLGPEEQMMLEEFGDDYRAYRERSARLIPGVW